MDILELKVIQNREAVLKLISDLESLKEEEKNPKTINELCIAYNSLSLITLNDNQPQESLENLRKAESLSYDSLYHRAITLNSIGSFYRKQGKTVTGFKYVERSLSLYPTGEAYLNLCALLNLQNKHEKALETAMHTVMFLQDEAFEHLYDLKSIDEHKIEILSTAFYNLALQLEYLKRSDEASSYYKKSVEFSQKYLSKGNTIKETLKQIFNQIIAKPNRGLEQKRRSEPVIKMIKLKKRVVIKSSRSKSPFGKPFIAEPKISEKNSHKKFFHRKFVKSGISKAKYIESVLPITMRRESSGEEDDESKKMTSTQIVKMDE